MKVALLLLMASASALAQGQLSQTDCLNNCGQYSGDCLACHNQNDAAQYFADYTWVCPSCSAAEAAVRPTVPFQAKPTDRVLAFIENLAVKKDPKLATLMAMTPEKHIALMQRAVHLRLDGPLLGACSKAFKVGTLERLPVEIDATRRRLLVAQAKP